ESYPTKKENLTASGYSVPLTLVSSDTSKSKVKPIPTTLNGKSTLNNASALKWQMTSRDDDNCFACGKNRKASVMSASRKSPNSLDGITTISFGELAEAVTQQRTAFFSTPTAITKSTAPV